MVRPAAPLHLPEPDSTRRLRLRHERPGRHRHHDRDRRGDGRDGVARARVRPGQPAARRRQGPDPGGGRRPDAGGTDARRHDTAVDDAALRHPLVDRPDAGRHDALRAGPGTDRGSRPRGMSAGAPGPRWRRLSRRRSRTLGPRGGGEAAGPASSRPSCPKRRGWRRRPAGQRCRSVKSRQGIAQVLAGPDRLVPAVDEGVPRDDARRRGGRHLDGQAAAVGVQRSSPRACAGHPVCPRRRAARRPSVPRPASSCRGRPGSSPPAPVCRTTPSARSSPGRRSRCRWRRG